MRLHHKINHGWTPGQTMDSRWAERVEREAEQTSAANARAYVNAQRRLAKAEERLERLTHAAVGVTTRAIANAEAAVEARRQELLHYDAMMKSSPASAAHRGRKSFRPVPYSDDRGGL